MTARRRAILNVSATGFLVLFATLLVLFWARWGCETTRRGLLPRRTWSLDLDVSSLIMPRTAQEPNGVRGILHARMDMDQIDSEMLGAFQYLATRAEGAPDWPIVVRGGNGRDGMRYYYDRSLRTLVHESSEAVHQPNGTYATKATVAYAGPEGVADKPDRKIGRFSDPLVHFVGGNLDRPVVYDRGLRRFFAVDWHNKTVEQGPELPAKMAAPVDFDWPRKQPGNLSLYLETSEPHYVHGEAPDRTLVLDEAGDVRMLNLETLEYGGLVRKLDRDGKEYSNVARFAGRLPAPDTLFPPVGHVTPDDLSAYNVLPIFFGKGDTYAGCAVAVVSRDATAMKLEVFDANGTSVVMQPSVFKDPFTMAAGVGRHVPPSTVSALYFEAPGAAVLTATKYMLECLHPPVLLWLSYFTTSDTEAIAGHQSLFMLADSFAAMKARQVDLPAISRFTTSLVFLIPGVFLGVLLAIAIDRDARRMGVSRRSRRLWAAAMVLFGLPAFVTYKLTRPTTARVTCANCGRDRWVDWEKCHHCGSLWLVPELIPPAWRVIGRPEEQTDNEPSPRPEETISGKSEV